MSISGIFAEYLSDVRYIEEVQEHFARTGEPKMLDAAAPAFERMFNRPTFIILSARIQSFLLNGAGAIYLRRYEVKGHPVDLDQAIALIQQAIDLTPPDSPEWPGYLSNLGVGLRQRYGHTNALVDLEAAIAANQEAAKRTPPDSPQWPSVLGNLATSLYARYDRIGVLVDLEAAIAADQEALERIPPDSPERPSFLSHLGVGLRKRYDRIGVLVDLEAAIAADQEAFGDTPPDSPHRPRLLNNLGNDLLERYGRTRAPVDLEVAIAVYQEALERIPPDSPERPGRLSNLGGALYTRYGRTRALDDLEAAIAANQEALEHTLPDSPERPGRLTTLGVGLLNRYDRYTRTGALDDLEVAIAVYQEALERTPPDSPKRPGRLSNLGAGLRKRYDRIGALADLEATRSVYRQACEQGLVMDAAAALSAARAWGAWALQRHAWEEAAKAYDYGAQAVERLLAVQMLRAGKENWLRDAQGLSACAAYALAQADKLERAVETLEAGQARLLAEALERHRRDLEQLPSLGHGEILERYQQALTRWDHVVYLAEHPETTKLTGSALRSALEAAYSELNGVIEAIRHVPDYGSFLQAPTFVQIRAAAQQTPLAYLLVTPVGGLALIVSPASETKNPEQHQAVRPIWLNELTDSALDEAVYGNAPAPGDTAPLGGYLGAYDRWSIEPKKMETREQWFQILENTTHWLWEVLMGPLLAALAQPADAIARREGTVPTAVLIPIGLLGLLPLHAAWIEDNHAVPPSRWYALDTVALRYAPNARALSVAQELAREVAAEHILLFVEPQPVSAGRLSAAKKEAQAILSYWPQATRTTRWHAAATKEELTALLPTHDVFHFSGHAFAGGDDAYQGGLLLAFDQCFLVREWQNLRLKMRLAVLSACETGMLGTKLPDEVIGLPTALAEAGVAGIVASLWSVDDDSTAWLMAQFYRLWRQEKLLPPEALRRAQMDLRNYDSYNHPFYWGAFTYTGV